MATKQSTVDFLLEQISVAGVVRARKMFGEYALYCDEKVVALVCDEVLFVKPTDVGRKLLENPVESPPYPGAKKYFQIPDEYWDDSQFMSTLVRLTALSLPTKKK